MQKSIFRSKKRTNLKAILLGLCLSIILHAILSLPGAAVLNVMKNPTAAVGIVGIATHLIAGIITAFAVCRYKAEGSVFTCFAFSVSFFALALVCSLLTQGGDLSPVGIINSAIYTVECTLFAVILKWLRGKRR